MDFLSSWAKGIIIAIIIGTIIEMILPKSSNSKYVKVVIGIFILFTIIIPIIGTIDDKILDTNSIFDNTDYENIDTYTNISSNNIEEQKVFQISNIYKENLQFDIQNKIQQKGYKSEINSLEISDDDKFQIIRLEIKIIEKDQKYFEEKKVASIIDNIETVKINLKNKNDNKKEIISVLDEKEKTELKKYLAEIYELKQDKIFII